MLDILKNWRITLFGFLSWAIPFLLAIPFFDQTGQLAVQRELFKSLMVVIGGGVGVILLVMAFQRVQPTFASGAIIGLYWLAINLILDLCILIPMSGMDTTLYFIDIGLRYLLLPIISTAIGYVADRAR